MNSFCSGKRPYHSGVGVFEVDPHQVSGDQDLWDINIRNSGILWYFLVNQQFGP